MATEQKGIIAWFTRNPVAANLLMVAIIIAGLFTTLTIRKEVFPQITLNNVQVQVAYPGATPRDVESGILVKIEEALRGIEGIKSARGTAVEGLGTYTVEVEDGIDVDSVQDKIRQRVDAIRTFPEQAEQPEIFRQENLRDVILVQLSGALTEREMKQLALTIRDELTALPAVPLAEIRGARDWEISIELSEQVLREYGLTFDEVAQRVRLSSLDLAGGTIKAANGEILLRTAGQATTASEFEQIVLTSRADGSNLVLGDVARIDDGFEERDSYSRFDGKPSIGIAIKSFSDSNDLAIVEAVNGYVETRQLALAPGVSLDTWADSTVNLQGRLDLMLDNMKFGALLVFLFLALFLNLRLAFWVIVGLPVSFLGALALMPAEAVDLSINVISLFGFILVLGIVVDDAIIIAESAYAEVERSGSGTNSVIAGAKRVAMPATFGVLTTIAAFVPMITVEGPFGVIWRSIGMVVILCLIFSIIESKWILPAHIAHIKRADGKGPLARLRRSFDGLLKSFIQRVYRPLLSLSLTYRYTTVALFFGLLLLSVGLVRSGMVRWIFFPDIPSDFINVQLVMEEGTSAAKTNRTLDQLLTALQQTEAQLQREYDQAIFSHSFAEATSEREGRIKVELDNSGERELDALALVNEWREQVPPLSGVRTLKFTASTNPGGGAALGFRLQGKDLEQVAQARDALRQQLSGFEGVYDIDDSFAGGKPELKLRLLPEAEVLGVTLSDLARQVRQGFYGEEIQRVPRGGEDVPVMLRYPLSERRSLDDLQNTRIRTASGVEVPFTEVAEARLEEGFGQILRIDGLLTITVSAAVNKALTEPSRIVEAIEADFRPLLDSRFPGVTMALDGASEQERDALLGFAQGGVFTLLAIFALMAIPLRSYVQPLIIMSVIPFGIIGAIVGHLIVGIPLSVLSITGIIALAGVVVNDSLILVDFVNRARSRGEAIRDAVINAGTARFRAIILTSVTTFVGLVPILSETSLQAKIVIPMAVSLAFGILFATVITLFLIPALYLFLDDLGRIRGAVKQLYSRQPKSAPVEAA